MLMPSVRGLLNASPTEVTAPRGRPIQRRLPRAGGGSHGVAAARTLPARSRGPGPAPGGGRRGSRPAAALHRTDRPNCLLPAEPSAVLEATEITSASHSRLGVRRTVRQRLRAAPEMTAAAPTASVDNSAVRTVVGRVTDRSAMDRRRRPLPPPHPPVRTAAPSAAHSRKCSPARVRRPCITPAAADARRRSCLWLATARQ